MHLHTRRRVLVVAAAIAGGLAGCSGSDGSSQSSTDTDHEDRGPDVPEEKLATDPPTIVARSASERPAIRSPDADSTDATGDRSTPNRRRTNTLVGESDAEALGLTDDAAEVTVTDTAGTTTTADAEEQNAALSAFVSATDFESESLYLQTMPVEACFRLSLCYVSWHDGIQTDYGRRLRPYDERCAVDERIAESRLIRLPVALEEVSTGSYGTSVSGNGCDWPPDAAESTGNLSTSPNASGSTDGGESA